MGRIYNALDRFLPFDRVLDPMFGGGQVQTAARQPQAPMVPQMAPREGIASVMGFPAMPPMPGSPQAPQAPQRRVPKVSPWRVLDGVLGGATISESLDAERARPAQQEAAAQRAQLRANLPADQQAVFDVSPELWAQYFGKPKEAQRPQRFTTPGGIVEFGEDDEPTMAYPFPEKPVVAAPAPAGYRWGADGVTLEYIPGGPADPRTVGVRASAGRAPPRKPAPRSSTAPAATGGIKWD